MDRASQAGALLSVIAPGLAVLAWQSARKGYVLQIEAD